MDSVPPDGAGEQAPLAEGGNFFQIAYHLATGAIPERHGIHIQTYEPIAAAETRLILRFGRPQADSVEIRESILELPPSDVEAWRGYSLAFFAWFIDPPTTTTPDDPRVLWFTSDDPTLPQFCLRVLHAVARFGDSPLVAEQLWLPGTPERCSIRGLEHEHRANDIGRALGVDSAATADTKIRPRR